VGWDTSSVRTEEGKSLSVEMHARYTAYQASLAGHYNSRITSDSNSFNVEYSIIKDFGEFWIDPASVRFDAGRGRRAVQRPGRF